MREGLWVVAEAKRGFGAREVDTEVRVVVSAESGFTHHVAWFQDRNLAELAVKAVNQLQKRREDQHG